MGGAPFHHRPRCSAASSVSSHPIFSLHSIFPLFSGSLPQDTVYHTWTLPGRSPPPQWQDVLHTLSRYHVCGCRRLLRLQCPHLNSPLCSHTKSRVWHPSSPSKCHPYSLSFSGSGLRHPKCFPTYPVHQPTLLIPSGDTARIRPPPAPSPSQATSPSPPIPAGASSLNLPPHSCPLRSVSHRAGNLTLRPV